MKIQKSQYQEKLNLHRLIKALKLSTDRNRFLRPKQKTKPYSGDRPIFGQKRKSPKNFLSN